MTHIVPYQKPKRPKRKKEYKSPIVWLRSIRTSKSELFKIEEKKK